MPKSHPVSVRIDPDALEHAREIARRTDLSIGQAISRLVEEGLKMHRCAGIIFTDGPTGRRATVAGSGIDVWEVIRATKAGANRRESARMFPRLTPGQIDVAFTYYTCFPEEIDRRTRENDVSFGTLQRRSPFIKKVRVEVCPGSFLTSTSIRPPLSSSGARDTTLRQSTRGNIWACSTPKSWNWRPPSAGPSSHTPSWISRPSRASGSPGADATAASSSFTNGRFHSAR